MWEVEPGFSLAGPAATRFGEHIVRRRRTPRHDTRTAPPRSPADTADLSRRDDLTQSAPACEGSPCGATCRLESAHREGCRASRADGGREFEICRPCPGGDQGPEAA